MPVSFLSGLSSSSFFFSLGGREKTRAFGISYLGNSNRSAKRLALTEDTSKWEITATDYDANEIKKNKKAAFEVMCSKVFLRQPVSRFIIILEFLKKKRASELLASFPPNRSSCF